MNSTNNYGTAGDEADKRQVQVKFFTRQAELIPRLPDIPIMVPTQLKRYGLSEVVHHLLVRIDEGNDVTNG